MTRLPGQASRLPKTQLKEGRKIANTTPINNKSVLPKIFPVLYCASFKGLNEDQGQEATTMKEFFDDSVFAISAGLFACSLAVGLALVYAMDKFI